MNQKNLLALLLGILLLAGLVLGAYHIGNRTSDPLSKTNTFLEIEIGSATPPEIPFESLSVSGVIEQYGEKGYLSPVFRIPRLPNKEGWEGSHSIELLGLGDRVLGTYNFEPSLTMAEGETSRPGVYGFSLRLPVTQGVKAIRLKYGARVLHELRPGPNVPEIRIVFPKVPMEKTPTNSLEAKWDARDEDGDQMTHGAWYSQDGGHRWIAIGQFPHPVLSWDISRLEETNQGFILILASDGVNTGATFLGPLTIGKISEKDSSEYTPN